jgi:FMN phosphatase YigB (HAD superfamily)
MNIGFDFDGVLCPTPFGRLAVHAPEPVDDLPENYRALYDAPSKSNPLRLLMEYARFSWRGADPHAAELLRDLASRHSLYIVTGRSRKGELLMERWLKARGWRDYISGIHMAPSGLRPPQHKLAVAQMLGIGAHIDDDPRTAHHLAKHGVRAYLLDHAGAQGDAPVPDNLTLVNSLPDFAKKLADERA